MTRSAVFIAMASMLLVPFASQAANDGSEGINGIIQQLGLPPAPDHQPFTPAELRSSVISRLDGARDTFGKCLTYVEAHFKNQDIDKLLKSIPQPPGQIVAVGTATFDAVKRAAGGADGLSQRDLDFCVRSVDVQIGGRIDYVRTLRQIDRSVYKCVKVLDQGVPSTAAANVLAGLARTPGSAGYTTSATLTALDRAYGRPTGLTRLDLDTCASIYDVAWTNPTGGQTTVADDSYCQPNQTFCPPMGGGGGACCNSDQDCAYSCDEDDCEPYCEAQACFPGDAVVHTEDGSIKSMRDIQVGDRVQVVHADGSVGFEDVYLLTHKDPSTASTYVRLELASSRSLVLSPRHFIPVATGSAEWDARVVLGADEVKEGDKVWYLAGDGTRQLATVTIATRQAAEGAFNPLTMQGLIVVDGVVTSAHSDWFLDGYVSADTQAVVYQAMMAPVRGLYTLIGPDWTRTIAEDWGVVDAAREGSTTPAAIAGWTAGFLALVLGLAFLLRRRRTVAA